MTEITTIDLMRHGEVEGGSRFRGSTDDPLTELGWQQMLDTLSTGSEWTQIISSPLQRCKRFASHWAEINSLPLSINNNFQEMHFGDWEGKTAKEIIACDPNALEKFWQDPNEFAPANSERLSEFKHRILTAWEETIKQYQGRHILHISHGGVIRSILAYILEMPDHALLKLEMPLAGISRINIYHEQGRPDSSSLIFHAGTL